MSTYKLNDPNEIPASQKISIAVAMTLLFLVMIWLSQTTPPQASALASTACTWQPVDTVNEYKSLPTEFFVLNGENLQGGKHPIQIVLTSIQAFFIVINDVKTDANLVDINGSKHFELQVALNPGDHWRIDRASGFAQVTLALKSYKPC